MDPQHVGSLRTAGLMTVEVLSHSRLMLTSGCGERFELIWGSGSWDAGRPSATREVSEILHDWLVDLVVRVD